MHLTKMSLVLCMVNQLHMSFKKTQVGYHMMLAARDVGQINQVRQLVCVLKFFDKYIHVASYPCYIDVL